MNDKIITKLRNNWFRVGILLILITTILIITYYIEQTRNHKLIIECRNLGEKLDKEINPPPNRGAKLMSQYYYNPKLKKCFYCGGYTADGFIAETIIDAYTNREIESYIRSININNSSEGDRDAVARFVKLRRLLFNEIKNPNKYEIDIIRQSIQ